MTVPCVPVAMTTARTRRRRRREQHSARNGANHDAGHWLHDDTANNERAAAGIVGRLSCADDRGKRRDARCDPTAVYAGHRPGCGDDAASDAEHAINSTGDARRPIDSSERAQDAGRAGHDGPRHVEPAGDPEPVVALATEGVIVMRTESPWVRRLWPYEGWTFGRPAGAEPESYGASYDIHSVTNRIHVRTTEWIVSRWPCWPTSWLYDPSSLKQNE